MTPNLQASVATGGCAVGGAGIGNEIEKRRAEDVYRVHDARQLRRD